MVGIAMAAALACAGCGGKKAAGTSPPTTSSTAPMETTTTTVGVDQVPAVITVEYAQRVMNALDKAEGDATRLLYAAKKPTPEWHDRLAALRVGKALEGAEADYGRDAAHDFDSYRNPPGDPVTVVKAIVDSSASCVVFEATRDFGPLFAAPDDSPLPDSTVFLRLKGNTSDALHANPTAWVITGDGQLKADVALEKPCH